MTSSPQPKRQRTEEEAPLVVRQSEFDCQICLDVAREASETNCCHNLFCHACISQVVSACPTCRAKPLKFSPVPSLRRIIGNFEIPCPNGGCGIITSRSGLKDHDARCKFKECVCPIVGCNFKVIRADYVRHLFEGEGHLKSVENPVVVIDRRKLAEVDAPLAANGSDGPNRDQTMAVNLIAAALESSIRKFNPRLRLDSAEQTTPVCDGGNVAESGSGASTSDQQI